MRPRSGRNRSDSPTGRAAGEAEDGGGDPGKVRSELSLPIVRLPSGARDITSMHAHEELLRLSPRLDSTEAFPSSREVYVGSTPHRDEDRELRGAAVLTPRASLRLPASARLDLTPPRTPASVFGDVPPGIRPLSRQSHDSTRTTGSSRLLGGAQSSPGPGTGRRSRASSRLPVHEVQSDVDREVSDLLHLASSIAGTRALRSRTPSVAAGTDPAFQALRSAANTKHDRSIPSPPPSRPQTTPARDRLHEPPSSARVRPSSPASDKEEVRFNSSRASVVSEAEAPTRVAHSPSARESGADQPAQAPSDAAHQHPQLLHNHTTSGVAGRTPTAFEPSLPSPLPLPPTSFDSTPMLPAVSQHAEVVPSSRAPAAPAASVSAASEAPVLVPEPSSPTRPSSRSSRPGSGTRGSSKKKAKKKSPSRAGSASREAPRDSTESSDGSHFRPTAAAERASVQPVRALFVDLHSITASRVSLCPRFTDAPETRVTEVVAAGRLSTVVRPEGAIFGVVRIVENGHADEDVLEHVPGDAHAAPVLRGRGAAALAPFRPAYDASGLRLELFPGKNTTLQDVRAALVRGIVYANQKGAGAHGSFRRFHFEFGRVASVAIVDADLSGVAAAPSNPSVPMATTKSKQKIVRVVEIVQSAEVEVRFLQRLPLTRYPPRHAGVHPFGALLSDSLQRFDTKKDSYARFAVEAVVSHGNSATDVFTPANEGTGPLSRVTSTWNPGTGTFTVCAASSISTGEDFAIAIRALSFSNTAGILMDTAERRVDLSVRDLVFERTLGEVKSEPVAFTMGDAEATVECSPCVEESGPDLWMRDVAVASRAVATIAVDLSTTSSGREARTREVSMMLQARHNALHVHRSLRKLAHVGILAGRMRSGGRESADEAGALPLETSATNRPDESAREPQASVHLQPGSEVPTEGQQEAPSRAPLTRDARPPRVTFEESRNRPQRSKEKGADAGGETLEVRHGDHEDTVTVRELKSEFTAEEWRKLEARLLLTASQLPVLTSDVQLDWTALFRQEEQLIRAALESDEAKWRSKMATEGALRSPGFSAPTRLPPLGPIEIGSPVRNVAAAVIEEHARSPSPPPPGLSRIRRDRRHLRLFGVFADEAELPAMRWNSAAAFRTDREGWASLVLPVAALEGPTTVGIDLIPSRGVALADLSMFVSSRTVPSHLDNEWVAEPVEDRLRRVRIPPIDRCAVPFDEASVEAERAYYVSVHSASPFASFVVHAHLIGSGAPTEEGPDESYFQRVMDRIHAQYGPLLTQARSSRQQVPCATPPRSRASAKESLTTLLRSSSVDRGLERASVSHPPSGVFELLGISTSARGRRSEGQWDADDGASMVSSISGAWGTESLVEASSVSAPAPDGGGDMDATDSFIEGDDAGTAKAWRTAIEEPELFDLDREGEAIGALSWTADPIANPITQSNAATTPSRSREARIRPALYSTPICDTVGFGRVSVATPLRAVGLLPIVDPLAITTPLRSKPTVTTTAAVPVDVKRMATHRGRQRPADRHRRLRFLVNTIVAASSEPVVRCEPPPRPATSEAVLRGSTMEEVWNRRLGELTETKKAAARRAREAHLESRVRRRALRSAVRSTTTQPTETPIRDREQHNDPTAPLGAMLDLLDLVELRRECD